MRFRFILSGTLPALVLAGASLCAAQAAQQQKAPQPFTVPSAPAAPGEPRFPPVDKANFTADSPTAETVNAFLKASWGYDNSRVWEVYAIEKTPVEGLSKVLVLVAQREHPQQIANLSFFVAPDGKHLIANESVLDFGAQPYAPANQVLQQRADGPSRGASAKQFELVEFADFECPHCKAAQPIVDKLLKDFPQAHFVFQNFPLVRIHPAAYQAANYGLCVAKQGGNDAFFKYADAVFNSQEQLPAGVEKTLAAAVTTAGQDPAKVSACAASAEGKAAVDASLKLAQDLHVDQTPMLYIDGRPIPIGGVVDGPATGGALSYDQLKEIITYQFSLDK
ncbi:thioredoxin domain-containing protein [Paracidobacterium acidisoli]|uniref:Thioredoxin n=1 Tax=Paracidobacterium acidisoli TaxID=2303751 RepID=A0A372ISR9_9BACT|nr:thioredoxin domain-containing protein [Paracidobacterium acidisoli]MBT9330241.1 thioredoxin domain-containing protein [Paracidobacterium acidisoli]